MYERDEGIGGLMRFGVPDAKLEKWIIDRRVRLLEAEGVQFECNVDVGKDITAEQLRGRHDAVVIATGSRIHRDLDVAGRDLDGVHFAMDYLYQRNRWVAEQEGRPARPAEQPIMAGGKRVVVIGGGDTGMDCVSNALREGAPRRDDPRRLSRAAGERPRRPDTVAAGAQAHADDLRARRGRRAALVQAGHRARGRGWPRRARARPPVTGTSSRDLEAVPGSEFVEEADLVLIAIGFSGPSKPLLAAARGRRRPPRQRQGRHLRGLGRGVFAAGDARMGQSLIVWAIAEGRKCARVVDRYLIGLRPAEPPLEPEEAFEPHTGELEMPSDAVYGD